MTVARRKMKEYGKHTHKPGKRTSTMAENSASQPPAVLEIQARLRDIALELRQSTSLDSSARTALAELLDELTRTLETENLPAAELTELAETTAGLAEALHRQQNEGIVGKAKESFQRAVTSAEAHAPLAVGLARTLLDALANIGI
jgi:hypothetical protein